MIDDADGASAPRVILTSEKLFMVVATYAQYEGLFAGRAAGAVFDKDECFSREPP